MSDRWTVEFHWRFEQEFDRLPCDVQQELLANAEVVARMGPWAGRPRVDTLVGSRHANMKELRFSGQGVWRVAFAFDPERRAILLVAGDKAGEKQRRFYRKLIERADARFDEHLEQLKRNE